MQSRFLKTDPTYLRLAVINVRRRSGVSLSGISKTGTHLARIGIDDARHKYARADDMSRAWVAQLALETRQLLDLRDSVTMHRRLYHVVFPFRLPPKIDTTTKGHSALYQITQTDQNYVDCFWQLDIRIFYNFESKKYINIIGYKTIVNVLPT